MKYTKGKTDLGMCWIDVYRAPGDLYESHDIVTVRPIIVNGEQHWEGDRFPDARYGCDQPEHPRYDDNNPPTAHHLIQIVTERDVNGWTHTELVIKEKGKGDHFVSRRI